MHRRRLPRVHSFAPPSELVHACAPHAHLSAALSVRSLSRAPSHVGAARTPFQLPSLSPQNMAPAPFTAWDSTAKMSQTFSGGFQNATHVGESPTALGAFGSKSRRVLYETGNDAMTKEQAVSELEAAKNSDDIERLRSSIYRAKQFGVPRKKLDKADIVLQRLEVQQAIQAAREANDVETLRNTLRRAAHTGIDDRLLKEAQQHLEVLEAEEILIISMRNNVTGHLKKCIDVAEFKGARKELIAEARAIYDRSCAETKLAAAVRSGEAEKIQAAITEAETSGTSHKELEYAQSTLASLSEKPAEMKDPEKTQDDPVEQRLVVAINLRETGALLKAISLADRADKVAELEVEQAAKNGVELPPPKTHEALIADAQSLVAELEVCMQLPAAMRKRDRKKLRAVVEKAEACMKQRRVEFPDMAQAQNLLFLLDASETLREAMAAKTRDPVQLRAAVQEARHAGVEHTRIQKAEQALLGLQVREQLHEAIESSDPEQLSQVLHAAKASGLERREVEKAEQLLRSWLKRA